MHPTNSSKNGHPSQTVRNDAGDAVGAELFCMFMELQVQDVQV